MKGSPYLRAAILLNSKNNHMYRIIKAKRSSISVNNSYEGEMLEKKICRMKNNKEPFTAEVALIHTERNDGVKPEHDIRTDRFEIAIDATSYIEKSHRAKREAIHKPKGDDDPKPPGSDGGPEPTQATTK